VKTSKAKREKLLKMTTEEVMKYLFPSKKLRKKAYDVAHENDGTAKRKKATVTSRKGNKTK
jgi:hypothetical protein